jgi:hypothetical protein
MREFNAISSLIIKLIPLLFAGIFGLFKLIFSRSSGPSTAGVDRSAEAYARQHAPLFISRYIDLARSGQYQRIPAEVRPAFVNYAERGTRAAPDVQPMIHKMLYSHRIATSRDMPLP